MVPPGISGDLLDALTVVRRAQREIAQSRERLAATQSVLGTSVERLCETDRCLDEASTALCRGFRPTVSS